MNDLKKQLDEDRSSSQSRDSSLFKDMTAIDEKHTNLHKAHVLETVYVHKVPKLCEDRDKAIEDIEWCKTHIRSSEKALEDLTNKFTQLASLLTGHINNVMGEYNAIQKQLVSLREVTEGNRQLLQGNDAYFNRVVVDLKKEFNDKINENSMAACLMMIDSIKEIKTKYETLLLTINDINKRSADTEKRSDLVEKKLGEMLYPKVKK